ncbi:succinate dehydrogenase [ubiquinone] cytochrome b small subunit, mitochondrial [Phlebotomus argentipes]|uniref:succinate dehydrogenase [ubiquinone] cytochrome b small subunit, mitochondrial n=1 Tax=Phlebotomus argentipes TaxID=94469 RepID=UPI002892B9DB|nr:succinate dehydrogenase [ubiquinone] cytochrome b small subunit, mitochondrial [Phlebotomus argentipes]
MTARVSNCAFEIVGICFSPQRQPQKSLFHAKNPQICGLIALKTRVTMASILATTLRFSRPLVASASRFGATASVSPFSQLAGASRRSILGATKPINLAAPVQKLTTSSVKMSSAGGSHHHDKLWVFERFLSAGLLGLLPVAFLHPSAIGDTILAAAMVIHSYIGFKSVVTDYVRPVVFGTVIPPIAQGLLLLLTIATAAGLIQFIRNDVGIANAVKRVWAIKPAP